MQQQHARARRALGRRQHARAQLVPAAERLRPRGPRQHVERLAPAQLRARLLAAQRERETLPTQQQRPCPCQRRGDGARPRRRAAHRLRLWRRRRRRRRREQWWGCMQCWCRQHCRQCHRDSDGQRWTVTVMVVVMVTVTVVDSLRYHPALLVRTHLKEKHVPRVDKLARVLQCHLYVHMREVWHRCNCQALEEGRR